MTWAFVLTAAIPTVAVLIGMLMNNGRFNDLSKRMDDLSANMMQHRNEVSATLLQFRNEVHADIQMLIGWDREREKGQ